MDRFDDDTLFAEVRELRPTPRPGFTAELDRRAAAGFPRGERSSASFKPFAVVAEWWKGRPLPKHLVPALGMAFTVLVVATVVVAVATSGGGSGSSSLERSDGGFLSEMTPNSSSSESAEAGGGGAAAEAEGEAMLEAAPAEESAGAGAEEAESSSEEVVPMTKAVPPPNGNDQAATAPGTRDIERSAYIVLGTKPDEVSSASAKVYEAVHAANGVVLHSSVQSGNAGATGASFDLLIPSAKLNDTLAAFSSIAEVRQRHDATNDITAPTVSVAEELADSNATIDSLLKQLGDAETEAEQESVEARLREERRRHAAIRASLDNLHQRASMSKVTLRIVTNHGAGVTPPSKDGGGWDVGDALHDAGHVLTIAAGVLLIGLAVLAPFALFGLIFWAGNRIRVRRLRERTLG
jgi:hypothetical protein